VRHSSYLVKFIPIGDYCASKYAAIGFHEALRQEIHRLYVSLLSYYVSIFRPMDHLIHTTLVCPGLILTGMFSGIRVKSPFLTPPLTPDQVVDCLENALNDVVDVTVGLILFHFTDSCKRTYKRFPKVCLKNFCPCQQRYICHLPRPVPKYSFELTC
jgi:hypothetical protein